MSTEIAKSTPGYLALGHTPDEVQEILAANLGGQELSAFDLPKVKIPGAGGTTWEIPSIDGDTANKVLEGIVIHFKLVRSYWPGAFSGSEPPACSSLDSKIGVGNPGGACDVCEFSQYGSSENGRGQACKQMEQWFLLPHDALLPLVVTLPPASLAGARKYRLNLTNAMLQLRGVVTRLTLAKDTNPSGQEYSYAVPALASRLAPDEAERAKAYADSIRTILDRTPATVTTTDPDADLVDRATQIENEGMVF